MNKFATTLCIAGSVLALAACSTSETYDSGASYATERTAGEVDNAMKKTPADAEKAERVFKTYQSK